MSILIEKHPLEAFTQVGPCDSPTVGYETTFKKIMQPSHRSEGYMRIMFGLELFHTQSIA